MSNLVAEQILRGLVKKWEEFEDKTKDPTKITKAELIVELMHLRKGYGQAVQYVAKQDEEEKRRAQAS